MDKQTLITEAQSLIANYRPNDQVLAQLAHINLIAVVGPSGAGKSTVTRRSGLPYVIGDTTRPPRQGEAHGVDYNFRTDFGPMLDEIRRGEYVQLVIQRGTEIYGTKAASYPASGACAMSILASVVPLFKTLGFANVLPVYVVPPDYSEWMRRIGTHRDKDLEARLLEAKESLSIALSDTSFVFILNDNLETAVATMQNIARGNIDQTASSRARSAASTLYEHLGRVIR